jgi:hypothetical protein
MRDIRDRLDLYDVRTVGRGFISYALYSEVILHRAQCVEIDQVYATTARMTFFETSSEAGLWLSENCRFSWSNCPVCGPASDLSIDPQSLPEKR